MFASADTRRFNFSSSSSQQGDSDRRASVRDAAASAAPASSSADRPFIDLGHARVKTLSFLLNIFGGWAITYTNVVHLPRRRAGSAAAAEGSSARRAFVSSCDHDVEPPRPSLLIAATCLYSHDVIASDLADDLILRRDLFDANEDDDDFLPGWDRSDVRDKRYPEGLLMDERNGALLIGGEGGIWIEMGVEVSGVPSRGEQSRLKRVGTLCATDEESPLECSLSDLKLQMVHDLFDAKAGDGSFLIHELIKDNTKSALRLVQDDVFSNPHVITIYLAQKYDCEFFTPLSHDRLIVQTGENGRWTEEVLIDYSKLKHLGRPITRADIQSVWDERKPLKFKNGVKLNSNAIVQVREHELVIAEETRLHYASFDVTAGGMQITVHQSLGRGDLMLDGGSMSASFRDIGLIVPISLGALLVIDFDPKAGCWHRLVYDERYEHADFVDRWAPSIAVQRTLAIERTKSRTQRRRRPAGAAASATQEREAHQAAPAATAAAASSASVALSTPKRRRSRPPQDRQAVDEEEEHQQDDGDAMMMDDSPIPAVPPSRPSAKKQRVDELAASSSGGVAHSRPIGAQNEDVQMAAAAGQIPALPPGLPSHIGAAAASSSSVPRSVPSSLPPVAAAACAPTPSPSAAPAAPASAPSLLDFQRSLSNIDAEELEDKRRIAESECDFTGRAANRVYTKGVITAKEKAAREIEEAQRELDETISQLDEVRARALQEAVARLDCQLRAIDAEMLLHRTQ
jgi:hypothetical protein